MDKVRVGVIGAYRGSSMINYCEIAGNAEVVAICDKLEEVLQKQKEMLKNDSITYYTSFDEFIKHDMDAVVLANYANEHAPFAIKAMKEGKHVFSEVVPVQTMKEAVELIEAIEETGKIYAYGENYCYMPAVYEMKKLFQEGKIGEFEYGECEYVHNCEPVWHNLTYGDKNHWRNNLYSTFYCTHSLGPIIHMTGLRPVKVTGFEGAHNARTWMVGAKSASLGIEMVTLENGAIVKSIHGGLYKDSVWYSVYGSKGRMESAREDAKAGDVHTIYVNADKYAGEYGEEQLEVYKPEERNGQDECISNFGHAGSDYYCMYHFIEKIKGKEDADIIDVFEALDMFLPGMFAYRSILNGGISMDIPNLRDEEQREKYRHDTMCTIPEAAGDMLIPCCSTGNPEIDDKVYEIMKEKWQRDLVDDSSYISVVLNQGRSKETE